MTKQDNNTKQNSKEDVVIGSVKRDPLKLFHKTGNKKFFGFVLFIFILIFVLIVSIYAYNLYKDKQSSNNATQNRQQNLVDITNSINMGEDSSSILDKINNTPELENTLEKEKLIATKLINDNKCSDALNILIAAEQKFGLDEYMANMIIQCAISQNDNKLVIQYLNKMINIVENKTEYPLKEESISKLNASLEYYKSL